MVFLLIYLNIMNIQKIIIYNIVGKIQENTEQAFCNENDNHYQMIVIIIKGDDLLTTYKLYTSCYFMDFYKNFRVGLFFIIENHYQLVWSSGKSAAIIDIN